MSFSTVPYSGGPSSWMNPWFPSSSGFGPSSSSWMSPFGGYDYPYGGSSRSMMPFSGFGGSEMDRMMRDMDRTMRSADRNLQRVFSSELNFQPSRPGSMLEHYSLMNPIRVDGEGNRWLSCYFDMRSFKPEEVHVTLSTKERCISVEANHEVKDSKEHYIKRHYSRKVFLPEDLKIDLSKIELKSCLTNEGLLCIEAPLPKMSLEEARSPSGAKALSASSGQGTVFPISVKTV